MAEPDATSTTQMLLRVIRGDEGAVEDLFPHVYGELRTLAQAMLRRERAGHTLQATALVNEAYLRLVDTSHDSLENRAHFLGIAARCMRQILVDHARRRGARKRGGDRDRVVLDEALAHVEKDGVDVLALNEALEKLAELDERKAKVVELRSFGGLTAKETAEVLGVSHKTVEADWYFARAWLRKELGADVETSG